MNSKNWKLSLFALAAVTLFSAACSHKKKSKPGSPYTGIWILQDNLEDYRNRQDSGEFCSRVGQNFNRYSDRQYNIRALQIEPNGDVFNYVPGQPVTAPGFRERNLIGQISGVGLFTAGRIGHDGKFVATPMSAGGQFGAYDWPSQTNVMMNGANLNIWIGNSALTFVRQSNVFANEYAQYVSPCIKQYRERHVHVERGYRGAPPVPSEGGYDPRIRQGGVPPLRKDQDPRAVRRPLAPPPVDPEFDQDPDGASELGQPPVSRPYGR